MYICSCFFLHLFACCSQSFQVLSSFTAVQTHYHLFYVLHSQANHRQWDPINPHHSPSPLSYPISPSQSWSATVLVSPQLHCTIPALRFLPAPSMTPYSIPNPLPNPPILSALLPFHPLPLLDAYAEALTPSPQRETPPHVFCTVAPMALSVHTIYVHVYLYIHTRPYFSIDHTFTYIYICRYDMCSYVYMYEMLHHMLHRHLVNLHERVRTNILFSSRNAAADVRGHT